MAALGGAGVAFITIRKDIEARGLKPEDPLPAEHIATIKAAFGSGGSVWDETHAGEGS
ncbi:MAG: hypothetical protein RB191_04885 [Terriglobia bacterium]|nr:hypothetical protein [Terriglobia bacterium]